MIKYPSHNGHDSSRGFSLTEVMVSVGVLSVLSLGVMQIFSTVETTQRAMRNKSTQDALIVRIRQIASMPIAIFQSAASVASPGNAALANCAFPSTGCNILSPDAQVPFNLYQPSGTLNTLVSGTVDRPVSYSLAGAQGPRDASHPIEVTTWFWATCSEGKSACNQAETIHIRYQVRERSYPGSGRVLKEFPPDEQFTANRSMFALAVPVSYLKKALAASQICTDPAALMTGRNSNGSIVCRCHPSLIQTPAANIGGVTCTPPGGSNCPAGFEVVGINNFNWTIQCVRPRFRCFGVGNCDNAGCDCGLGAWLQTINIGICTGSSNKKDPPTVTCAPTTAICCQNSL